MANVKAKSKEKLVAKSKAKVATKVNKDKVIVKPNSKNKAKRKTTAKVKPAVRKEFRKKQLVKDLFSYQEIDGPDLNTSTGYPAHPNRIWPD